MMIRVHSLMLSLALSIPFAIIALAAPVTPAYAELPQISDARLVQPPPGANVAAAFFTINNPGDQALDITDATSDVAKNVELHLSFVENDVARMQKQESVTVPAGETLELKHGSYHIMLIGLNKDLVAGDAMSLTLNTSAGDLQVTVPIISLEQSMHSSHSKDSSAKPEPLSEDLNKDMNH